MWVQIDIEFVKPYDKSLSSTVARLWNVAVFQLNSVKLKILEFVYFDLALIFANKQKARSKVKHFLFTVSEASSR